MTIAMEGPWYTIKESLQKLEIVHSDFLHLVSTGKIRPVAHTKTRKFLMFHRTDGNWIGHAICEYRGHISLHKDCINDLLDGEKITLGKGNGVLLEEHGIINWNTTYPFKKPLPHPPLTQWVGIEKHSRSISHLAATPIPNERISFVTGLTKAIDSITSHIEETKKVTDTIRVADDLEKVIWPTSSLNLNDESDQQLFFSNNSTFEPDCLRIPHSEIEHYRKTLLPTPHQNLTKFTFDGSSDGRENQLHTLIARIIDVHPNITAKAAWRILEAESSSDNPLFDSEGILQIVDANCIEWRSRHGKEQSLQLSSLPPLISTIKKRLKKSGN